MSQSSMETKITKLESKLINIESKLDEVLKQLKTEKQAKRTIVRKSPQKVKAQQVSSTPTSDKILLTEHTDGIILVTGDTYDIRHLLKPYRAKWEPEKKGWSIYTKNITNYSSFKNNLQSNCNKLTVRPTSKPFRASAVNNSASRGATVGICQIESSSDED